MSRRRACPPLALLVLLAAGAAAAQSAATQPATAPGRDWRQQPFSRRSPWNHPLGSAAAYAPVPGLSAVPIGFNYEGRWTASVVIASAEDPTVAMLFSPNWGPTSSWSFLDRGHPNCGNPAAAERALRRAAAASPPPTAMNYYSTTAAANDHRWVGPSGYHPATADWRGTFRLPAGACPSPDSDGLMAVFQPDGWVIDIYAAVVLSSGEVVGTMASWIDARGDGTGWWNGRRASMLPSFAGLIRAGEIAAGRIPHALALQVPPSLLKRQAVWPAYAFDRDSGYSGALPMGALLAIPPDVDVERLGLSRAGRVIARALQDYGAYVVDRGGRGITVLAELGDPDIQWDARGGGPASWQDLATLRDHLRWVTNNGPASRGGGGTPRRPLAAHPRRD
ncbi:hypothetical protein KF840_10040 [bacterium]|nr:hypothetical protein [bacterium]